PKVEPTPARPTAPAPPPATGPADTARLTAALLAEGELPGVDYQVTSDDRGTGWLTPVSMNTDPPECAVFAQESIHNAGAPVAWSHQEYRGAAPGGMAMGVTLSSHRDDAGSRLLADLDRALAPCATGFTVDSVAVSTPKLWTVAPVDGAPLIGDETLAYRIDVLGGGGNETVTVVLIRFGPTVAHFVYRGNAAPDTAPYAALIAGQVQKARAQLGR
ncbi:MAG: hypothetical protein HOV68_31300, partial [Streptomycetaceae bacterium]|nr:hypothetical protein [Streptomycetaceae bacterium]